MMDGAGPTPDLRIDTMALDRLMPMHLCLSPSGHIFACGPTLRKLVPDTRLIGRWFFEMFEIRRPSGLNSLPQLQRRAGDRLYLSLRGQPNPGFRGIALPLADGQGMLINLSFGIAVIDAVRNHSLTDADFAA
ncbi:MAG: GGDEF domain-containing protein, partial [Paracoccaceae bacterium]